MKVLFLFQVKMMLNQLPRAITDPGRNIYLRTCTYLRTLKAGEVSVFHLALCIFSQLEAVDRITVVLM